MFNAQSFITLKPSRRFQAKFFQMNLIATFHTLPSLNPSGHLGFVNFMFETGFCETGDLNKLQQREMKLNLFVGVSLEK